MSAESNMSKQLRTNTVPEAIRNSDPIVVDIRINGGNSSGSGFIFSSKGKILTCASVVANEYRNKPVPKGVILVTLIDGSEHVAELENIDFRADVAVIKINSSSLPVAKMINNVVKGELIVALGSPSSLNFTATPGVIRHVGRRGSSIRLGKPDWNYLQLNCVVDAGNYGGPVVNMDSQVVGMVCDQKKDAHGVCFAIPTNHLTEILESFEMHRVIDCWWIGAKVGNAVLSSSIKELGARVLMVTPGSPADEAGLSGLDEIIEVGGEKVTDARMFNKKMKKNVGEMMSLLVKRPNHGNRVVNIKPQDVIFG